MPTLRPTFSESWYRVADLKVKMRASAQISRVHYRGERWYVVRDPAGNQFHRLSAPAYKFVGLLDGTRTVAEAWELVGGQLADDAPTQNEVIQILSQLHSANLIEANVTPDAAVLLRRHKKMLKRQWQGRLMNILFPRIPLWDPDSFIQRWMPVMRGLLSWFGAILWLVVVIGAAVMVAPEWPRLRAAASNAMDPGNWPFLWASFVLIKIIHELGHGFATRRFGGEVHEMGVMFLVLVPCPYVDASTAWAFPSKWARVFVGAGGMIFELFIASIMAFVWLNTAENSLINELAYNVMLIASVSTVIFNANPLLRYDGYYILSDWLEIPNLRYKSTEYSMGLIKRHLFKVRNPQPLPPIGQRFWLLFYAIASTIYRTLIGIAIILMVWQKVPVLGVLMALGGVVTWLAVPVVKTLKYLLIDPELHRKRVRAALWTAAMVGAVVVVVGLIRFPIHYEAMAWTEGIVQRSVFAEVNGVVERAADGVADGVMVKAGQEILICSDRELELKIAELEAQLRSKQAQLAEATVTDQNARLMVLQQIGAIRKELDNKLDDQKKLRIKAPADGRLVMPTLPHMVGKYVPRGTELAMIVQDHKLRVIASLDQTDGALPYFKALKRGEQADIRIASAIGVKGYKATMEGLGEDDEWRRPTPTWQALPPPMNVLNGGPEETDPTDAEGKKLLRPHVRVYLVMDNPDGRFVPGQRAHLRFDLERQPLYVNWSRRIWQLIQAHSRGPWT